MKTGMLNSFASTFILPTCTLIYHKASLTPHHVPTFWFCCKERLEYLLATFSGIPLPLSLTLMDT